MWQHRQQERDLRRTETDILKQRRQLQKTMKDYETSECLTAACTLYSGTPPLWALWGPGEVSCIQWNPHLGDLVKCPVYSGTPLVWAPWGPGEMSCLERCSHFMSIFILRKHV